MEPDQKEASLVSIVASGFLAFLLLIVILAVMIGEHFHIRWCSRIMEDFHQDEREFSVGQLR